MTGGDTKRFSLPALNIQRGRDHGLPSYNKYREFCGIMKAKNFEDFTNIPTDLLDRFKMVYKHPDDVDLWTGGISETPVNGGIVGETFTCNIIFNFKKLLIKIVKIFLLHAIQIVKKLIWFFI